jgi:hypothetical protein
VDAKMIARLEKSFEQRSLGYHPFIRPQFVTSALPASHLGSQTGAALVILPPPEGEEGNTLYAAGVGFVDGGIRFGRWVGLDAGIGGAAGVGGRGGEALDFGASASWNWRASAVVRMLQSRTTALSIRPLIRGSNGTGLSLRPGLKAIAAQAQGDDSLDFNEASRYMVTQTWTAGGVVHLSLAQSIGRHLGLQVSLGGGASAVGASTYDGEEQTSRASQAEVDGGFALSFDANPVPFALQLEYDVDVGIGLGDLSGNTGVGHNIGLGLYLNGMTNTFGLELAATLGAITQLNARLGYRAYF